MEAFEWNDHPFYLDQYDNKFILFFDIGTLTIASVIVALVFFVWIYQLFLKKAPPIAKRKQPSSPRSGASMASNDSLQVSKEDTSGKKKPKIDMSLPTLTVANKSADSVPESSKSDNKAATEVSHSNQTPTPERPDSPKRQTEQSSKPSRSSGNETQKHQGIHPLSKCLVTTSIVCATVYLWCLTTFVVLCIVSQHPPCAYLSLIFELIFSQRLCLYFYYFHRLYLSFYDSVYAMDKTRLITMATVITIFWIGGQVFYFVWNSIVGDCTEASGLIGIIPLALTEMCTSALCIFLFLKKLKRINVAKQKDFGDKMQYLISKLTILATVTIASTFCVFSLWPFTAWLGLLAIDTPVNIICLVLSFGFYDQYYRMLCGKCRKIVDPTYKGEQTEVTV